MAGLYPKIIDVDTFALQNAYDILPSESQEETILLVDIGASKTSLNILKEKTSLMMRDTVSGTNQIIEEISSQFDISEDEAEQIVNGGGTNDIVDQDKIQEICNSISQDWCAEICEVVNTYQASGDYDTIGKIVLSGGGVFIKGFKDLLLSELDAEVSIINPFEAILVNEKKFSDSFITRIGPLAPIAIGLALRRVDDK